MTVQRAAFFCISKIREFDDRGFFVAICDGATPCVKEFLAQDPTLVYEF